MIEEIHSPLAVINRLFKESKAGLIRPLSTVMDSLCAKAKHVPRSIVEESCDDIVSTAIRLYVTDSVYCFRRYLGPCCPLLQGPRGLMESGTFPSPKNRNLAGTQPCICQKLSKRNEANSSLSSLSRFPCSMTLMLSNSSRQVPLCASGAWSRLEQTPGTNLSVQQELFSTVLHV
jgi:hypothetical protein